MLMQNLCCDFGFKSITFCDNYLHTARTKVYVGAVKLILCELMSASYNKQSLVYNMYIININCFSHLA